MADEPNKKMDEMLRAYAEKRRAVAPASSIHPATRRLLQGEVARVHGRPRTARGWRAWIPQIAFGASLGVFVLLAVAVLRRPPVEELASADLQAKAQKDLAVVAPEKESDDSLGKLAAAPLLESREQEQLSTTVDLPSSKLEEASLALAPRQAEQLAAAGASANASVPAAPALADSVELKKTTVAAAPASLPAPASASAPAGRARAAGFSAPAETRTESLARADDMANPGGALRMRFIQTDPAVPGAGAGLLRSFQMEQLGYQVRLTDRDGSVYVGSLQDQTNAPAAPLPPADRELAARARAYSIQATGLNRTLGRAMTVVGQYLDSTNHPPAALILGSAIMETNLIPIRAVATDR